MDICTGKEHPVSPEESYDYQDKFKYADEEQLSFRKELTKLDQKQKQMKDNREATKFLSMEERQRVCDELEDFDSNENRKGS